MVRSDGPPGVTTESGTRFQAVWKRLRERLAELSKRADGRRGEPPSPVLVRPFLRRTTSLGWLLPIPTLLR